jgi:serine protease AprX
MRSLIIISCAVLVLFSFQQIQGGEQNVAEGLKIRLKADTFDPLKDQPDIPQPLKLTTPNNYYLIQCAGPIQPGWINQLEDRGIVILGYIPDYAYVVYMEETAKALVEQFPFVRWTGFYHPAYKIDPRLRLSGGDIELNVVVFRENGGDENLSEATGRIQELGGEIMYDGKDNFVLIVKIDASKIDDIAFIPEVEWIDESFPKVTCMDNVRQFTGADTVHTCGFDGTGIVGGVFDNGLELDHPDFEGQILATCGGPVDAAHGTCVFGILFSSGANNEQAKGMLPNAQGVFCHFYGSRTQSMLCMQDHGAVFQCSGFTMEDYSGHYTRYSAEDDYCAFYSDITQVWPAGNGGDNGPQSIASDGAAKNVITVGALLHNNNADREDDEWGPYPGAGIGLPSYGPAADGRVKPDLCGPYEDIFTTDSEDGDGDNGYRVGAYVTLSDDGKFGGTSAATAVVAGATGIVYQMYRENLFGNNPSGDTPHASTVKALLIVDAHQYEFAQATRYQQGWGLPDLRKTLEIADGHFIVDEEIALQTGESIEYSFTPEEGSPLKISLVWTDPRAMIGADLALVNDLNLKVTAPDATIYWGNYGLESSHWSTSGGVADSLNNVENVFIENPQPGQWTVEVIAVNIAQDGHIQTPEVDQDFALVATTIPAYIRGDCNRDDVIDLGDVVYLINYVFRNGDPPDPIEAGDCNCDTVVDLEDVVYLINYLYRGGDPPGC